jgi:hypothetical protein
MIEFFLKSQIWVLGEEGKRRGLRLKQLAYSRVRCTGYVNVSNPAHQEVMRELIPALCVHLFTCPEAIAGATVNNRRARDILGVILVRILPRKCFCSQERLI